MEMAVDMVEWQAGRAKSLELGVDFGTQLGAQAALEEITEPRARRVVGELAVAVHKTGDLFRGQGGAAAQ